MQRRIKQHGLAWSAGLALVSLAYGADARIRVACVGDSITAGWGTNSYPFRLGQRLGAAYEVRNFGVSSTTAQKQGDVPYDTQEAFTNALAFDPDWVLFMLGTNDSKPQNWRDREAFAADYEALLQRFRTLPAAPRIVCCLPPPAFSNAWGIQPAIIREDIIPVIRQTAESHHHPVADLYRLLENKPEYIPDTIHPNFEGQALIAAELAEAIRGSDAPMPAMPPSPPPRLDLYGGGASYTLPLIRNNDTPVEPVQTTSVKIRWERPDLLRVDFRVEDVDDRPFGSRHDDPLYYGDLVAVYYQPDLAADRYFEIEVNSAGIVFDNAVRYNGGRPQSEVGWTAPLQPQARAGGASNLWEATFWIPLDGELKPAQPTDPGLGLNVYRIDFNGTNRWNLYAWSPTGAGTFHRLESFGRIRLKP